MKTKIIIAAILLTSLSFPQNVYEVEPGTKGNQIKLTLSNTSENAAENVQLTLLNTDNAGNFVNFQNETKTIEAIEPNKEELVTFIFDVKRDAPVNTKDTIDFMITYMNGTNMKKSFILNYTPPKDYKLEQNFPNPFNPTTTIQYQLPMDSKVTLKVYDILGSEVVTLISEEQEAGYKEVQFNAANFASGIYIYRLATSKYVSTKKMLLVK